MGLVYIGPAEIQSSVLIVPESCLGNLYMQNSFCVNQVRL